MSSHSEVWRKAVCKANAERVPKLWKDPVWRERELARRAAVNAKLKAEGYKRGSEAIKALWADPKYRAKVMRTRRRTMYSNPKWKEKAARAGAIAASTMFNGRNWNAGHTKETHPGLMKISESLTGRVPHYNHMIWLYRNGPICIPMWSSYELLFARWCDARNIKWQYEPRWFNIGKGDWRGVSYTPDFYLPALDTYIELKGYFSVENKRKMQAFYQKFPNIKLYLLQWKGMQALRITREHIPHRKPIFQHPAKLYKEFV